MKKIIIIDDQFTVLKALITLLVEEGYKVDTATNGYQGLILIQSFIPDLIIIDLNMPVWDGFKTIEQVRKYPNLKNIPIIVLTGIVNVDCINKIKKFGIKDYIKKPFGKDELLKRIKTTLDKQSIEEEIVSQYEEIEKSDN
ncbi:MAG: response regulator [Actinomycetia bacterium]|nr:response regulator [Actinomycetes bacterium]